jgi:hypothetical protein
MSATQYVFVHCLRHYLAYRIHQNDARARLEKSKNRFAQPAYDFYSSPHVKKPVCKQTGFIF